MEKRGYNAREAKRFKQKGLVRCALYSSFTVGRASLSILVKQVSVESQASGGSSTSSSIAFVSASVGQQNAEPVSETAACAEQQKARSGRNSDSA